MNAILGKTSTLTVQDLKRLLFRCAATVIALDKVYANVIVLKLWLTIGSANILSSIISSLCHSRCSHHLPWLLALRFGRGL